MITPYRLAPPGSHLKRCSYRGREMGRCQQKNGARRPRFVWHQALSVLQQLDGHRSGFTAADTQAGYTALAAGALERVDQGENDA
jgi:hypothetical protein